MVEKLSSTLEEVLSEILFQPEAMKIKKRDNPNLRSGKTSKIRVTNSILEYFRVPVRNQECKDDECIKELQEFIPILEMLKDVSVDSVYKCPFCEKERTLKQLYIDLSVVGVIPTLRSMTYNSLRSTLCFFRLMF